MKRIVAFCTAILMCTGFLFNDFSSPAITTNAESESYDISTQAQRLKEIAEEQKRIDEEINSTKDDIEKETKNQEAIIKKIKIVNEKIDVINSYLTELELEMTTNQRLIDTKKKEIDNGIEDFKKRIRAMYLAGDSSYTSVLLSSNDFYDILMRMELVKRVADYDNQMIDNLYELKAQYEDAQAEMEEKQAEYDKQNADLESEKKNLDELYETSKTAKKELQEQRDQLEEQNETYLKERQQFESDLSGLFKSSYGDSSDDTARMAAELAANAALESLHDYYNQRIENGEEIPEDESQYNFLWPVPDHYHVSSGVGPRWGSYHNGLDITGGKGTDITAAESGTVIRANLSCTHDYGKDESCGCGGGYGNYIIIDHGNEFLTLYGHLTSIDVNVGDVVKKGDKIGGMGSTGNSTGDHLHFEIRYQGYYLNPALYVSIT